MWFMSILMWSFWQLMFEDCVYNTQRFIVFGFDFADFSFFLFLVGEIV